ncbi:DUF397 domain-containing protein [Saccharopolyspora sp. NPDC000359]|uniref:DUF397 domain-containing protein n=1 Tax=Saccharopolyspora sp. NPDC000359 TaxID=3154251 RepID=UPI00331A03F5
MRGSPAVRWRRSSRSMGHGACVESLALTVASRLQKDQKVPVLEFSRSEWGAGLARLIGLCVADRVIIFRLRSRVVCPLR